MVNGPQSSSPPEEIINFNSGKCAEVYGWGTGNGDAVDQWTCYGNANQLWVFNLYNVNGNLVYQIVNKNSGKCLEAAGWNKSNGGKIDQWTCLYSNGAPDANQLWLYITGSQATWLGNLNSRLTLEVLGQSKSNGARVDQYDLNGGNNQFWYCGGSGCPI